MKRNAGSPAKPKRKPRPSKTARALVDYFAEAAKYHGWQEAAGTGPPVTSAQRSFEQARFLLEEYILKIQLQLNKARARLRYPRGDFQ